MLIFVTSHRHREDRNLRGWIGTELKQIVGVKANILRDKVYEEQQERAVREGIIMQSCDGFGRRIYLRPVVQTELGFTEADRPF
ncbi:MAG: hypothetical protein IJ618_00060 [Prevotella sp.]|nr:hypothetical protein [Prevotella sp.]